MQKEYIQKIEEEIMRLFRLTMHSTDVYLTVKGQKQLLSIVRRELRKSYKKGQKDGIEINPLEDTFNKRIL